MGAWKEKRKRGIIGTAGGDGFLISTSPTLFRGSVNSWDVRMIDTGNNSGWRGAMGGGGSHDVDTSVERRLCSKTSLSCCLQRLLCLETIRVT